ncbi:hypothetical protein bcere0020_7910 [Bacillus cereus Rock3-29]|nr:hypothetical protein bcere0020_7910 [Bacillus cereus Rock3-29]
MGLNKECIKDIIFFFFIDTNVFQCTLWAIWIVINPRKRQLQYTLFRGVFGIVCSVGLLVITQKFAYGMLGLQTPIYFVFSVGLYIFALNHYYKNHIKKLQGPIKKSKSSKKNSGFGVLAFIGLGQLIANISLGFVTQKMVAIVLMCVYSMLSFILFHFIMELHRYYYLRKRIEDGGRTHETF